MKKKLYMINFVLSSLIFFASLLVVFLILYIGHIIKF